MQVKLLCLLLVVPLVVACVSVQESRSSAASHQPVKPLVAKQAVVEKVATPLNAELLYNILAGELAGRRGDMSLASVFYANAAETSQDPDLALRAVQIAIYNKDAVRATSMVNILLENGQAGAQIHQLALTVYLASGEVAKSLKQAGALLAISKIPLRNTLLSLGDIITRSSNKQVAYGVMEGLIKKYPDESATYLARSQIALRFNDKTQAKQYAKKALDIGPNWSVAYVQLARVHESEGDIAAALRVMKDANARFADNRIAMKYAQLLAHNKQYKDAEQLFSSILAKDEKHHEARFSMALVVLKQGKAAEAKELFTMLHDAGAFSSKSAFYLGRISFGVGELKPAISWFEKVAQGPVYIDAQANVAMIKSTLGDLAGARAIAAKLRAIYPAKATRFYVLEGEFLADAEQYVELFELMTEAVKKSPDDLTLRYTRSIAAAELNKIDIVEDDLQTVLKREPNNVNALNALGYTLASKTFRFDEARGYLTKALSFRPDDSAILDSMGWLNYRSGRYEEALVLLEKAYSKQPEAEIALHLGETLWVLGRQREAKDLWQKAIQSFPKDKRLAEVLKKTQ
ncbi:MAG: hypothetical protein COB89_06420 [Piscirickettsiaceae bacterium]|nr:MAG: hypothetical protein COB89_06420 [Piscirickettsiaceae bacterium]